jgi:hypothetical protein
MHMKTQAAISSGPAAARRRNNLSARGQSPRCRTLPLTLGKGNGIPELPGPLGTRRSVVASAGYDCPAGVGSGTQPCRLGRSLGSILALCLVMTIRAARGTVHTLGLVRQVCHHGLSSVGTAPIPAWVAGRKRNRGEKDDGDHGFQTHRVGAVSCAANGRFLSAIVQEGLRQSRRCAMRLGCPPGYCQCKWT